MTVTYPDDATFNINNFSTIGSVTYTNTGSDTAFNLPTSVNHSGEVLPIVGSILQPPTAYYLSNTNATINFYDAPNTSNLTLRTITIPDRFTVLKTFPTMTAVNYSNTFITTVNSNTYTVDGATTTWALPENSTPSAKSDLLVSVSGAMQNDNSYTFPSTVLGNQGIDITPALTSNNTVEIRSLNSGIRTQCLARSMADRKPDRGHGTERKFSVVTYESIAGYEKRRLVSRRGKRSWKFSYTNITGIEKQALQDFYDARYGTYEAFYLDLSHLEDTGIAFARFEGPLQINHVATLGTNPHQKIYTVSVDMMEVFG